MSEPPEKIQNPRLLRILLKVKLGNLHAGKIIFLRILRDKKREISEGRN